MAESSAKLRGEKPLPEFEIVRDQHRDGMAIVYNELAGISRFVGLICAGACSNVGPGVAVDLRP